MGSIEDAKILAVITAVPQLAAPDETDSFLNAVSVGELASMWSALQRVSRRDQFGSVWAAKLYFDHLPHRMPDRALDLVFEVLRNETDKPTVMGLNDKLMPALIHWHGDDIIERLEREAKDNQKLRWLLGGIRFVAEGL